MIVGNLVLSIVPALLAVAGGAVLSRTYGGREAAATIEGAEVTEAGSVRAGQGLVALRGTAEPTTGETLPAPLAGTEGVVVKTVVEEQYAGERTEPDAGRAGPEWRRIHGAEAATPFAVADDTGQVPVDISDTTAFTVDAGATTVEAGADPPGAVRDWLEGVDLDPAPDAARNYRQGAIEPGEAVYAVGEPVDRDGETVLSGEDLAVADLEADALAAETGYGATGYAVGAVLLLAGVAPLAGIWLL